MSIGTHDLRFVNEACAREPFGRRTVSAQVVSCCVYNKQTFLMLHIKGNIPFAFDYTANPVVRIVLPTRELHDCEKHCPIYPGMSHLQINENITKHFLPKAMMMAYYDKTLHLRRRNVFLLKSRTRNAAHNLINKLSCSSKTCTTTTTRGTRTYERAKMTSNN